MRWNIGELAQIQIAVERKICYRIIVLVLNFILGEIAMSPTIIPGIKEKIFFTLLKHCYNKKLWRYNECIEFFTIDGAITYHQNPQLLIFSFFKWHCEWEQRKDEWWVQNKSLPGYFRFLSATWQLANNIVGSYILNN